MFSTSNVKEPKKYSSIIDLVLDVVNKRELTEERLDTKRKIQLDDPSNIQPRIATIPKLAIYIVHFWKMKYSIYISYINPQSFDNMGMSFSELV